MKKVNLNLFDMYSSSNISPMTLRSAPVSHAVPRNLSLSYCVDVVTNIYECKDTKYIRCLDGERESYEFRA